MTLSLPLRIVGIAGLISVVILAFFYRTEATGFTFAMGNGFNLRIDSHAIYNGVVQPGSTWALKNLVPGVDKFFNLGDVKPGDHGENTISFHVNKDSWICLDFENLKQKENGINEPESHEDPSGGGASGELAAKTEFFAWYDDGDDVFEVGELPIFGSSTPQTALQLFNNTTYALADAAAGAAFPANQTKYIGITWCFGNLTVNVPAATITCNGSALGNETQTDSFSVDIGFRAVPKKDNANFTCKKPGNSCRWDGCNTGSCKVTVTINNNGTIINNTTSNSDTGGNNAGAGGTATSGNALSTSNTMNILNQIRLRIGR